MCESRVKGQAICAINYKKRQSGLASFEIPSPQPDKCRCGPQKTLTKNKADTWLAGLLSPGRIATNDSEANGDLNKLN